ncbi:MAG: dihydropteroate synthase [Myxococcota bacterium]|jgi:dihydropteroate synthase|nr:dihydropteroate synthase [Myxococcota bacterium]
MATSTAFTLYRETIVQGVSLPPWPVFFAPAVSIPAPHAFERLELSASELNALPVEQPLSVAEGGSLLFARRAEAWRQLGGSPLEQEMRAALQQLRPASWRIGEQEHRFPLLMGILNCTPDSFSDGARYTHLDAALAHAQRLIEEGAQVLDVGGESTRPGADAVDVEEECRRVLPVIEALAKRHAVPLSVDTRKAEVARRALELGASVVNDVSAGADPEMLPLVAERRASWVAMHMRGQPQTMQRDTHYADLFGELIEYLESALLRAYSAGVDLRRILIDPGLGFGKDMRQNTALLVGSRHFACLGRGVLIGPSRKRFLGELTGREVQHRDAASCAAVTAALLSGASVLRVHDVAGARDALLLSSAVSEQSERGSWARF